MAKTYRVKTKQSRCCRSVGRTCVAGVVSKDAVSPATKEYTNILSTAKKNQLLCSLEGCILYLLLPGTEWAPGQSDT